MTVVAGPFFAAAGLLGAAGCMKLLQPGTTVEALRAARMPGTRSGRISLDRLVVGRVLGLAEVVVAMAAVLFGGRVTASLVAAAFAAFALFTARLLHIAGAGASCGCFGADSSPAEPLHIVANSAIAGLAALAVIWPTPGIGAVVRSQPLAGVPFLALCALLAWLLFAVLTVVAELRSARAGVPAGR